jgi:mono/diheme cytochrome c family protein
MKATSFAKVITIAGLAALAASTAIAQPSKLGQREYRNSCAVCHGISGKGDGSYGAIIEKRLPDLTVLQKNNGGVFPFTRVYETIDGTQMVKGHGTRDMPIWGDRYRVEAAEYYIDVPYDERAFVRARIMALIEHLSTLQAK